MNSTIARPGSAMARFGRRIASIVAESNYAQRRMMSLRATPDMYRPGADQAPADSAEFLVRT
jgi:hypothetical protein